MQKKKIIELLFIITLLFLALVVLTPRQWEPGNENWIRWATVRVFQEDGELPRYSTGPLYVFYLQLFSLFSYPFSLTLEYIITHLFLYLAFYAFLQRFLRRRYALLLTVAWIPHLATIEPGNNLFGIAFIFLYFMPGKSVFRNEGYFPPALLAAALSHPVYGTFLLGHTIGTFFERRLVLSSPPVQSLSLPVQPASELNLLHSNSTRFRFQYSFVKIVSLALLLLLFFIVTASPSRPEYNHILMDPTYAPVALESPDDAFFQNGVERYVRRTYPQEEWVYHDWYDSVPEAYGGATTMLEAIVKKPEIVFRNFLTNMGTGVQLPGFFFSGVFLGPVGLFFSIFLFFGGIGLFHRLKEDKNYSLLFSLLVGTAIALLILSLTTFNAVRYVSTLLPIGLLLLMNIISGFTIFTKNRLDKRAVGAIEGTDIKTENKKNTKTKIKIISVGIISLLTGLFLNGKVINALIFPHRILPEPVLQQIFILDTFLIAGGMVLLFFFKKISVFVQKKKESLYQQKERIALFLEKIAADGQGTKYLVLLSVLLLFLTIQYPSGTLQQVQSVISGEDFLSGQKPVSMVDSYPELRQYLHEDTAVLAREYTWVMAFTDVKLNNIHQIWSIPPFNASLQPTEEKLKNLDVVLVSYWLESDRPGLGMQTYPRYVFHVRPFLEKAISEGVGETEKWSEKKMESYGRVYVKKSN